MMHTESLPLESFVPFFEMHLDPLKYDWPVHPKTQAGLPGFQWHEKSGGAKESFQLKQFLTSQWVSADAAGQEELARWMVVDWGKVKRNAPERIKQYVAQASDTHAARPLKGVASYSKILSLADCTQYAIYDARVAACLNAVQLHLSGKDPLFFPYIPSQNRHFRKHKEPRNFVSFFSEYELVTRRKWRKVADEAAYTTYLALLHALQHHFLGKEIYHFEMVLFTQALTLCPQLFREQTQP